MKKTAIFIAAAFLVAGCASNKPTPTVQTPATPPEFLMATQQPHDLSISCAKITSEYHYTEAYIAAINHFFRTQGPTAMTSTAYTTTNGVATRYGNTTMGSSTSTTYGGGTVMVYPTLSIRAMNITSSVEARQRELRRLAQRRGDCPSNNLRASDKVLENQKRMLDSEQRTFNSNKEIMAQNDQLGVAGGMSAKDREELKFENKEFISKGQAKINAMEAEYQTSLKAHQALYERAEQEAQSKHKWFVENTKTVMQ